MARRPQAEVNAEREERRILAESSLEEFIKLVHKNRVLGNIHREVIHWWTRDEAKTHQLLLLPRDHGKSAMIAYRAAWEITRDPTIRILYISSTSNLATKQLKFIKDILTSDTYRTYWPEMVNKDETKREKWTEREISVDHPKRKDENVRDPTIFTAGLTSNIVGMHCDIAIMDDVVVQGNAYTEEGRERVKTQYGYLASIEAGGAREWLVGTRYHPKDLYNDLVQMIMDEYDETGRLVQKEPLFEVFERQVENVGDGTGEFLWPKQQRYDGKWFGFDIDILATKRAQYLNRTHFRAQYYNDPHDIDSSPIQRTLFQYYDQAYLHRQNGRWMFKDSPLNVFAAIDFAYSLGKRSDYTCIATVGVTRSGDYYILELDRFKTDKPSEYFNHILKAYERWGFRKIRAEVSVAQQAIVQGLKESYIRPNGLSLVIDEYRPTQRQGSKEERILAILEPKYANRQVWHYLGGNCQALEEELVYTNPPHDDIKDALASAIDFAVPPINMFFTPTESQYQYEFHSKFGGVA